MEIHKKDLFDLDGKQYTVVDSHTDGTIEDGGILYLTCRRVAGGMITDESAGGMESAVPPFFLQLIKETVMKAQDGSFSKIMLDDIRIIQRIFKNTAENRCVSFSKRLCFLQCLW